MIGPPARAKPAALRYNEVVAARKAMGSRELRAVAIAAMARRRQFASSVPDGTAGDTSQQSHYGESVGAVLALPDRARHAAPLPINSAAPAFTFFGPRGTKQSEVFPVRSLTFTENDVALPAERGNLEYAGLSLVYEGNRVKSALLGRDLNPLGRGDGVYYFAGQMMLPAAIENVRCCDLTQRSGNSVNNGDQYTVTDLDRDFLRCLQDLYEICAACVTLMKDIQDPCKRFRSCCENGHWYPPNWNANQKCDCIKEVVDAAQWNNCCRKDKPFWVPYFCRVARGGCKQLSTKQVGETECEQECDDAMNSLCCRAAAALGGNIEECRWLCFDDCENSGLGNAKDEALGCCKRKYAEQFAHVGGHCLIECMS